MCGRPVPQDWRFLVAPRFRMPKRLRSSPEHPYCQAWPGVAERQPAAWRATRAQPPRGRASTSRRSIFGSPTRQLSLGFIEKPSTKVVPPPTRLASKHGCNCSRQGSRIHCVALKFYCDLLHAHVLPVHQRGRQGNADYATLGLPMPLTAASLMESPQHHARIGSTSLADGASPSQSVPTLVV